MKMETYMFPEQKTDINYYILVYIVAKKTLWEA